jgi:hypothetical protein
MTDDQTRRRKMAGYLDTLLTVYQPQATPATLDTPWIDDSEEPAPGDLAIARSAPAETGGPYDEAPLPAPADDGSHTEVPPLAPLIAEQPPGLPGARDANLDGDDALPPGVHVPEAPDDLRSDNEVPSPPDPGGRDPAEPHEVIVETTNSVAETHVHETVLIVDENEPPDAPPSDHDFESEAATRADEDSALPAEEASPPPDTDALERELGEIWDRLNVRTSEPPEMLFRPDDYEPDRSDIGEEPLPEVPREVTQEIVREIHHHHHHHEPPAPAPARPAPTTASEASRIGSLRFMSDWKTRGTG